MKQMKEMDSIQRIANRFEYMNVFRFKDKNRIAEAMKIQDSIRNKSSGKFSGAKEIIKWREHR